LTTLAPGYYTAVVESVWPKDGQYGEYWEWHFRVEELRLKAFTSASLKSEKTRRYVEAVLDRSVDPGEEIYASFFGGERCTVEVGTTQKNGRMFNTVESVL
jgi:hypothetical protein